MAMMNGATMGQQAQPPPPAKTGGLEDLAQYIDKSKSECLNESDDHPYQHCLTSGGGHLASDCDEQLILSLSFHQVLKVQSMKIKAPSSSGPKTLRIFKNLPNTLDFSGAESMTSVQDLVLSAKQLDGEETIPLKVALTTTLLVLLINTNILFLTLKHHPHPTTSLPLSPVRQVPERPEHPALPQRQPGRGGRHAGGLPGVGGLPAANHQHEGPQEGRMRLKQVPEGPPPEDHLHLLLLPTRPAAMTCPGSNLQSCVADV